MLCPECVKEGKTSKVYPGCSFCTDMYCPPFYDEAGNYHHHDRNYVTTSYRCSNGHSFNECKKNSCWCGWPENTEAKEIEK